MPTHLSVATAIEKNRVSSDVAFVPLLEIDVKNPDTNEPVETLYFARNADDIVYRGTTYIRGGFDFDVQEEAGAQPAVTITVHDMTRALMTRMQEFGGGVGFTVRILVINSGNLTQDPEITEQFLVTGASAKDYDATFTLGAENPLLLRFPRRRQFRDQCQWRYKGPECGYAGGIASCDFTMNGGNGCVAHANAIRFGGFPGIGVNQNQGPG